MAYFHSPRIVTDGLVLALDAANVKSFRGEPTTNLFPTNILSSTNATKTLSSGKLRGTYNGWQATGVGNDNPRTTLFSGNISISSSTFYTLSCLYWSSNNIVDDVYLQFSDSGWTESDNYIQPFGEQSVTRNGSFSITDLGNGWKYCVGTFQTLNTTTSLVSMFFDVDVAGVVVFISNLQLEQKSYVTPYVNGTRGTTVATGGGWADLSGNGNHGELVNGPTYSSSNLGSLVFDGVNDYVDFGNILNDLSSLTAGFWIKNPNSNVIITKQYRVFEIRLSGNEFGGYVGRDPGSDFWYGIADNNNVLHGATLTNWNYFNYVIDYVNDTVNFYTNGLLRGTINVSGMFSTYTPTRNLNIGRRVEDNSAFFSGDISYLTLHNRALTAAEVLQNYNATKGRFGL